jgi:hypothetical protein
VTAAKAAHIQTMMPIGTSLTTLGPKKMILLARMKLILIPSGGALLFISITRNNDFDHI